MDASQITRLKQKQSMQVIHRPQTVDSSTLTWKQHIKASQVRPCSHETLAAPCTANGYGGQGKQTTLSTGSSQTFLSVYSGAKGSATQTYSSELLTLQKAGKHACAIPTVLPPIELPLCAPFCSDTNNPNLILDVNPYLPPFDTYYAAKHRMC